MYVSKKTARKLWEFGWWRKWCAEHKGELHFDLVPTTDDLLDALEALDGSPALYKPGKPGERNYYCKVHLETLYEGFGPNRAEAAADALLTVLEAGKEDKSDVRER